MGIKKQGNYVIRDNKAIFLEGEKVNTLDIKLKGKVDVYICLDNDSSYNDNNIIEKSIKLFSIEDNIFLGTIDLFLENKYSFSYIAANDTSLYAYKISELDKFDDLLSSQIELASLTIVSLSSMLKNSYYALNELENWMLRINSFAYNLSILYWHLKDKYNLTYTSSLPIISNSKSIYKELKENNTLTTKFSPDFLEYNNSKYEDYNYEYLAKSTKDKILYYENIMELPMNLIKSFFSANKYISLYHFSDSAKCIEEIKSHIRDCAKLCIDYFNKIFNINEECIFSELICLIREANKYNQNVEECFQVMDELITRINNISEIFLSKYNYDLGVDFNYILQEINQLKNIEESNDIKSNVNSGPDGIPEELVDSFEKILRYSNIPIEKAEIIRNGIDKFKKIKTNNTSDESERSITRTILPIFFEVYKNVLKKVINEENNSRLFKMFLNYGFMDESLLDTDQILTVYNLEDESNCNIPCKVYNSYQWLSQIYNKEKDPSINEFDEDYFDVFRGMVKSNKISKNEKNNYYNDKDRRLDFEIDNMFKITHRICSDQFSYFPILHKDSIINDLSKSHVLKEKINKELAKLLEIDFSAFHRELFYKNDSNSIEKELIYKFIPPEIIMVPVFGVRGSMWQVITGRDRSTPGRIILPIFTNENLEDILIKLIGNYRWEICRTMMGISWNDVTKPSLTSEYTDYIQFYKKNKDLSDEAKERIKRQIKRNNNHMREIFTSDYEIWIKHERKGNIRLNKVSRSILLKYCPFSKNIRNQLLRQPIFHEIVSSLNSIRQKEADVIERRYKKLLGNSLNKYPMLLDNLNFFKDM